MSSRSKLTFSFISFLRDQAYFLAIGITIWGIILLFLTAFHATLEIILMVSVAWLAFMVTALISMYWRRYSFYQQLCKNLNRLDQAYLVLETVDLPRFYDGELFYEALYQINKSMVENVQKYRTKSHEFQEYIEMWIHEVKTPLATLALITHDPKITAQIKIIDDYVEQVLYFARAENAERDYLISKCPLERVVGNVLNRNREILLAKHIEISSHDLNQEVYTDAKWLEFIVGQIINNSVKYQCTHLQLAAQRQQETVTLTIRDNGIGINEKDLPRVFDKSFTGSNGHHTNKSTGMGLYIVKTLCDRLGHQVSVRSEAGKFTEITLTFSQDNFYQVASTSS